MQEALRSGDELVITRLDRAGRSLKHLLEISEELTQKGVTLKVLDQAIDTSTSAGQFALHIIEAMAQFERADKRENQECHGWACARPEWRQAESSFPEGSAACPGSLRRRPGDRDLYDADQVTVKRIAAVVGVSQATLYRSLNTRTEPAANQPEPP